MDTRILPLLFGVLMLSSCSSEFLASRKSMKSSIAMDILLRSIRHHMSAREFILSKLPNNRTELNPIFKHAKSERGASGFSRRSNTLILMLHF